MDLVAGVGAAQGRRGSVRARARQAGDERQDAHRGRDGRQGGPAGAPVAALRSGGLAVQVAELHKHHPDKGEGELR